MRQIAFSPPRGKPSLDSDRLQRASKSSLLPSNGRQGRPIQQWSSEARLVTILPVGRHSRSCSTELQHLLPFVTYCGRFLGNCPLTDRSSIADIYCYRCSCIAPGSFSAR